MAAYMQLVQVSSVSDVCRLLNTQILDSVTLQAIVEQMNNKQRDQLLMPSKVTNVSIYAANLSNILKLDIFRPTNDLIKYIEHPSFSILLESNKFAWNTNELISALVKQETDNNLLAFLNSDLYPTYSVSERQIQHLKHYAHNLSILLDHPKINYTKPEDKTFNYLCQYTCLRDVLRKSYPHKVTTYEKKDAFLDDYCSVVFGQ